MNTPAMTEEQMVFLVRNALLVAGEEMGNGDEWPVVKDTIHKVMKDWEDLKVEREVDDILKVHTYEQLRKMESALDQCSPEAREKVEPLIAQLRETCDAYFEEIDPNAIEYDPQNAPMHIQRMRAIINTMED